MEDRAWDFLRENTNWFRSWVLPFVFPGQSHLNPENLELASVS